jgi:hypothetical protein
MRRAACATRQQDATTAPAKQEANLLCAIRSMYSRPLNADLTSDVDTSSCRRNRLDGLQSLTTHRQSKLPLGYQSCGSFLCSITPNFGLSLIFAAQTKASHTLQASTSAIEEVIA